MQVYPVAWLTETISQLIWLLLTFFEYSYHKHIAEKYAFLLFDNENTYILILLVQQHYVSSGDTMLYVHGRSALYALVDENQAEDKNIERAMIIIIQILKLSFVYQEILLTL